MLGPGDPSFLNSAKLEEVQCVKKIHSDWELWCFILSVVPQGAHRKPQGPKEHLKNFVKWTSPNLISVYTSVSHTSFTGCFPGSFCLNGGTAASSLLPEDLAISWSFLQLYALFSNSSGSSYGTFHSLPHLGFALYLPMRLPGPWKAYSTHLSFPAVPKECLVWWRDSIPAFEWINIKHHYFTYLGSCSSQQFSPYLHN